MPTSAWARFQVKSMSTTTWTWHTLRNSITIALSRGLPELRGLVPAYFFGAVNRVCHAHVCVGMFSGEEHVHDDVDLAHIT